MGIDRSSEGFSTKEIMLRFIDPRNLSALQPEIQAKLALLSHNLAQINKDLHNPLPTMLEILRTHLGSPIKGSQGADTLDRLMAFENTHLPNLNLQQEQLKRTYEEHKNLYQLLFTQGQNLRPAQIDQLDAKIASFRTTLVQNFINQKQELTERLEETAKLGVPLASRIIREEPTPLLPPPIRPQI